MVLTNCGYDMFKGRGVEVFIDSSEDFLKITETLTRVGVVEENQQVLWQHCHILHKRGRYRILHYKELLILDGQEIELLDDEINLRDQVIGMFKKWGLVKTFPDFHPKKFVPFKVVPYNQKSEWELKHHYRVGVKH